MLVSVQMPWNGVQYQKTFQIKVLVKNIPEKTLQGSVMSEEWLTFSLQCFKKVYANHYRTDHRRNFYYMTSDSK